MFISQRELHDIWYALRALRRDVGDSERFDGRPVVRESAENGTIGELRQIPRRIAALEDGKASSEAVDSLRDQMNALVAALGYEFKHEPSVPKRLVCVKRKKK